MEKSKIRKMKVKDSGTPFAIWFCGWLFTVSNWAFFINLKFFEVVEEVLHTILRT